MCTRQFTIAEQPAYSAIPGSNAGNGPQPAPPDATAPQSQHELDLPPVDPQAAAAAPPFQVPEDAEAEPDNTDGSPAEDKGDNPFAKKSAYWDEPWRVSPVSDNQWAVMRGDGQEYVGNADGTDIRRFTTRAQAQSHADSLNAARTARRIVANDESTCKKCGDPIYKSQYGWEHRAKPGISPSEHRHRVFPADSSPSKPKRKVEETSEGEDGLTDFGRELRRKFKTGKGATLSEPDYAMHLALQLHPQVREAVLGGRR